MPPLRNDWTAYQFDQAVLFVGLTIENALHEREQVGDAKHPEWRAKYTLSQLLEPSFRLPRPKSAHEERAQTGDALRAMLAGDARGRARSAAKTPKLPMSLATQLEARGVKL